MTDTLLKIVLLFWLLASLTACWPALPTATNTANDPNVSLGMVYLQQGDREKARLALNQALINAPRSPASWGAMAYLEELTGDLARARQDYLYAIQLAPHQGDGHNNYGAFLCRHQQPQAAIKQFLAATQTPSYITRAAAYENAGRCALRIPDRAAATTYFKAALRNDPNSKLALKELAVNCHD